MQEDGEEGERWNVIGLFMKIYTQPKEDRSSI
jgi:hypothetical protein